MANEIEVLTPQGASRLFHRSSEAVRTAARKGFVRTACEVNFSAKPVRLLDLHSARNYWEHEVPRLEPGSFESELERMRSWAVVVEMHWGERFRVLHPSWLASVVPGYLGTDPE